MKVHLLQTSLGKTLTLVALLLAWCFSAFAQQPGSIDASFNPADYGFGHGDGPNNYVRASAIQADGKILIGGKFTVYNNVTNNRIARLNTDGTLDAGFVPGTGANNDVLAVALQPDGKILVGGSFSQTNGASRNRISRLNADGTNDITFTPGTGVNSGNGAAPVNTIAVQPDGKIIIAGEFASYNGTARNNLARLNANGTLDAGFSIGTGANGMIRSVILQPDGKVIIAGDFTSYNGTARNRIARLNANGTLDTGFTPGTGANNPVKATALQPDGKIIIAGNFTSYSGTSRNRVARLNTDGTLDTGFNPGTGISSSFSVPSVTVNAITLTPTGDIILGGWFDLYDGATRIMLAKLSATGALVSGFNDTAGLSTIHPTSPTINTISLKPDGKLYIGGEFLFYKGLPRAFNAQLHANATVDTGFNPWYGISSTLLNTDFSPIHTFAAVYASAVQSDGKIIIAGQFTSYNGATVNNIARLHPDGSLDSSFVPGSGTDNTILAVAIQADGKIIIGGHFQKINGTTKHNIGRLNSDGSLDASFGSAYTAYGTNWKVRSLVTQPDGKILIGGEFTSYFGQTANRIIRVHADGTTDAGFTVGTGISGVSASVISVNSIVVQPDGKIILGGSFNGFNGTAVGGIVRVHANGTLDSSFGTGTGVGGNIFALALQPDGKIVAGGSYNNFNGSYARSLIRLEADGLLDQNFATGSGVLNNVATQQRGHVYAIRVQPNGRIIIAGDFISYNGTARASIARLNLDGTIDAGFDPGTGSPYPNTTATVFYGGPIATLALQGNGDILIGGTFTSYNGTGRNRIARIFGATGPEIATSSLGTSTLCPGQTISVPFTVSGTLNTGNVFTAQLSSASGSFASPVVIGTLAGSVSGIITATLPASLPSGAGYRIRVVASNPGITGSDNGMGLTVHTVTATASPTAICAGQTATLSASGATTYTWSAGQTQYQVLVNPATTTTYTVTGETTGCADTAFVTVLVHPMVQLSLNSAQATICDGESITLSATGAANYLWSTGQADSVITVTPAGTTLYSVTGTSAQGCASQASATITVNDLPVLSAPDIVTCEGQSVALAVSGPAGTAYSWTGPGGFTSTDQSPVVMPSGGTEVYNVTGTLNGCSGSATTMVTANPLPQVSVQASADTIAPGATITLTLTENNPLPGTVFQWSGPGLNQATGNTVTANPLVTGLVQYILTASNAGCSITDTVYVYVDAALSVQPGLKQISARVYPNPFSNNFSINFNSATTKAEVVLTDVLGRQVFYKTYQTQTGETTLQIQPEQALSQGMYLLQIKQNDHTQTIRIIKQ